MRVPQVADDVAEVWNQSWSTSSAWTLLVLSNLGLGTVLLVGGPQRVSSASFAAVRVVGHAPTGAVFAAAAVAYAMAAFRSRRVLSIAGYALTVLHLAMAAGFVAAALDQPDAALTGPVVYLALAAVMGINGAVYGRHGAGTGATAAASQRGRSQ